jgi:hypothetical protein
MITPNTGIGAITLRAIRARLDEAALSQGQPRPWRQTGSQVGRL